MVHGQKEAGSGTPSQRETRSVMDLDPDTQRSTEGGGLCTVNLALKCPPILATTNYRLEIIVFIVNIVLKILT